VADTYRTAIIGCGRTAKRQVIPYKADSRCELVAVADLDTGKATRFCSDWDVSPAVYSDFSEMIHKEQPDIVSVCLWPRLHARVNVALAELGVPAVHAEKPIAVTWGECLATAEAFRKSGTQLTFSHQRRFSPVIQRARAMLAGGDYGTAERIEAFNPDNIYDWGTHTLDLTCMFAGEAKPQWVMGQLDTREIRSWFDVPFEFASIASIRFDNDVRAVVHSGHDKEINGGLRLHCTHGIIEIHFEKTMRHMRFGEGVWHDWTFEGTDEEHTATTCAGVLDDIIAGLRGEHAPELGIDNAMRSSEIIYAIMESSRSRCRIDFPLDIDDSPLLTMLADGTLTL